MNKYETIRIDKVEDLLYDIRNEFENEIDTYETESGKELTDNDFEIMMEFLDNYLNKIELCLKDLKESEE